MQVGELPLGRCCLLIFGLRRADARTFAIGGIAVSSLSRPGPAWPRREAIRNKLIVAVQRRSLDLLPPANLSLLNLIASHGTLKRTQRLEKTPRQARSNPGLGRPFESTALTDSHGGISGLENPIRQFRSQKKKFLN